MATMLVIVNDGYCNGSIIRVSEFIIIIYKIEWVPCQVLTDLLKKLAILNNDRLF